jgi:hypothetical protein
VRPQTFEHWLFRVNHCQSAGSDSYLKEEFAQNADRFHTTKGYLDLQVLDKPG